MDKQLIHHANGQSSIPTEYGPANGSLIIDGGRPSLEAEMKFIVGLALIISTTAANAENFMIFNITQDFPLGIEGEVLRKNYYINMGSEQGLKSGTELAVYRTISINNPFAKNKKEVVNYKVKVGELKIIHAQSEHAIAMLSNFEKGNTYFEIDSLMIGDHIDTKAD